MELDDLTLRQAKQLAALFGGGQQPTPPGLDTHLIGKPVIIRTYSAGVHFGILDGRQGAEVRLKEARRIWFWNQAFTLSAVAVSGVGPESKLSVTVPEIVLTEAIEILPVSVVAADQLRTRAAHPTE